MTRPTRDGPSLDLDALRTVAATVVVDAASGGSDAPASEARPRDRLPASGRLVWIPPRGEPRELARSALRSGISAADPDGRRCPTCDAARSAETVVREHEPCGYVGLGGFLWGDGRGRLRCPKCEGSSSGSEADGDGDGAGEDGDDGDEDGDGADVATSGATTDEHERAVGASVADPAEDERSVPRAEADGAGSDPVVAGVVLDSAIEADRAVDGDGAVDGDDAVDGDSAVDGDRAVDEPDRPVAGDRAIGLVERAREVDGRCDVDERFPRVSTVHSCLGCGRILDRPLGGPRGGD